jgi:hypothetical protein
MKIKINNTEKIDEVPVDLTDSRREPVSIGKWNIELIKSRCWERNKQSVRLKLDNIQAPHLLYKENVLGIKIFRNTYYENKEIVDTLNCPETPFQVIFDKSAVYDCDEKQQPDSKSYNVSFDIVLEYDKGTTIVRHEEFQVLLSEVNAKLNVAINITQPTLTNNSKLHEENIGELIIENDSNLKYSPNVDYEVDFSVENTGLPCNDIYLKDHNNSPIPIRGGNKVSCSIKANMPLLVKSFSPIQYGAETFDIVAKVKYHNTGQNNAKELYVKAEAQFTVKLDTSVPQLKVEANWAAKNWKYIENGYNKTLPLINYSLGSSLFWDCFHLKISNIATSGKDGIGVIIRNFKCAPSIGDYTVAKFVQNKTLNAVFKSDPVDDTFLLNHSESKEVVVRFNQADIENIYTQDGDKRNYDSNVTFDISFDYWDDNVHWSKSAPPDKGAKQYKITFTVPIFQNPSNEWLGIDFGTSAIVCKYGNNPIDLRQKKKLLFPGESDNLEVGTSYLSSNVILRNNRDTTDSAINSDLLCDYSVNVPAPKYDSLAVTLSPTSTQEDKNVDFILPCLKMLLGYKYIPNIRQYKDFKYEYKDNGNVKTTPLYKIYDNKNIFYSPLCKVDTVMCEVYNELFTYFVKEKIHDISMMNNIVLSVPNTFSPTHYKLLENLIKKTFSENSGYSIRNVKFISESDAVACFYLKNWDSINKAVKREGVDALRNKEERVLVYDMGGGTLDITYFIRRGSDVIDVRGRMGIAKAGNYLDGLLAKIIAKKIPELQKVTEAKEITTSDRLKAARKLKEIIKDDLKPKMATNGATITIKRSDFQNIGINQDFTVSVDDIVNDNEFKKYIKSCTKEILENFLNFFPITKEGEYFNVDTIVISGRASKLPQIRSALIDEFIFLKPDQNHCVIDMSTALNGEDKSKDVVVEGALAYAERGGTLKVKSNNIMAHYGVIYQVSGMTKYLEMLNPRETEPVGNTEIGDMTVNEYETKNFSLGCIDNKLLTLVQTYSLSTLEDWKAGNTEYITVMGTLSVPDRLRSNVQLSLEVDKNNEMRLCLNSNGFTMPMSPDLIDVNSELNKKSMWPVKFNEYNQQ